METYPTEKEYGASFTEDKFVPFCYEEDVEVPNEEIQLFIAKEVARVYFEDKVSPQEISKFITDTDIFEPLKESYNEEIEQKIRRDGCL